jgi:hypothetical protein
MVGFSATLPPKIGMSALLASPVSARIAAGVDTEIERRGDIQTPVK